jgi:hypothetical protein
MACLKNRVSSVKDLGRLILARVAALGTPEHSSARFQLRRWLIEAVFRNRPIKPFVFSGSEKRTVCRHA